MSDFDFPWCNTCNNNFPMREEDYKSLEESGKTFYCPQGHAMKVWQQNVSRELRSAKRSLTYLRKEKDRMDKRADCLRGVQTRIKNRLLRGVCPYCCKSTHQMVLHIQQKHGKKE